MTYKAHFPIRPGEKLYCNDAGQTVGIRKSSKPDNRTDPFIWMIGHVHNVYIDHCHILATVTDIRQINDEWVITFKES